MLCRISISLLLLLLFVAPAFGAGKNKRQEVMPLTEVATGAAITVTIANPSNRTGYLIVKTENETATASLVVTVSNVSTLGNALVCTLTAITTNTTTIALLGSLIAAGGPLADACDFPMSRLVQLVFTTSGGGADFDVTAEIQWVTN